MPAKKIIEPKNIETSDIENNNIENNNIENNRIANNGRLSFRNAQHSQFGQSKSVPLNLSDQFRLPKQTPELSDEQLDISQQISLTRARQQRDLAMLRHAFRICLLKQQSDEDSLSYDNSESDIDNNNTYENSNNSHSDYACDCECELADKIRNVSSAELNQLVSAVIRIHNDERELLGITPPENENNDDEQYKQLEQLSVWQLIELCHKEGINPPDLCKTKDEKDADDSISKERPLGLPD